MVRKRAAKMALSVAATASVLSVSNVPAMSHAAEAAPIRQQHERSLAREARHTYRQTLKLSEARYQSGKRDASQAYKAALTAAGQDKTKRRLAWETYTKTLSNLDTTYLHERQEALALFQEQT